MSAPITSIPHCPEGYIECSKAREENKYCSHYKGRSETAHLHRQVYVEKSTESKEILLKTISTFEGYKINIEIYIVLYMKKKFKTCKKHSS